MEQLVKQKMMKKISNQKKMNNLCKQFEKY
mgnify:CR=1 FL=1